LKARSWSSFDADYLPEPAIIKHLVAPYIDPEVGSTMGRVVPYNTNANMLTKLIDLERRGGYVVDQQARSLLNFLPQFGGTCGSVRLAALNEAGGWRKDVLAEDTDLTYRLFLHGWTVEYLNHAACYEESPEHWPIRMKQVRRWAYGHNECMFRYFFKVLGCKRQPLVRRLDASLVLLFYMFPVLSLICLVMSLFYPLFFSYPPFNFSVVPAISFMIGFGNFSPYFQIMVGAHKDRPIRVHRLAAVHLHVVDDLDDCLGFRLLHEHLSLDCRQPVPLGQDNPVQDELSHGRDITASCLCDVAAGHDLLSYAVYGRYYIKSDTKLMFSLDDPICFNPEFHHQFLKQQMAKLPQAGARNDPSAMVQLIKLELADGPLNVSVPFSSMRFQVQSPDEEISVSSAYDVNLESAGLVPYVYGADVRVSAT
jgi:hypothetical protein